MALIIFEEALKKVHNHMDKLTFSETIRACRDAIGTKQYKTAEFLGISIGKIKNLETGYFREMPPTQVVHGLGALYDIKYSLLHKKAKEHVKVMKINRKVPVGMSD